jgi:hypothetical protein
LEHGLLCVPAADLMHKMPSTHAIRRIRIAAMLLLAKCLLTPAAAGVLIHSFVVQDPELSFIGLGMLLLTGLVVLLQWLVSTRANCPLCMTPVLANKDCMKHRSAKTLLGSHRLRVAVSLLFTGRFRCPYCGEPTVLVVRYPRNH